MFAVFQGSGKVWSLSEALINEVKSVRVFCGIFFIISEVIESWPGADLFLRDLMMLETSSGVVGGMIVVSGVWSSMLYCALICLSLSSCSGKVFSVNCCCRESAKISVFCGVVVAVWFL